jgi:hypothetical protein
MLRTNASCLPGASLNISNHVIGSSSAIASIGTPAVQASRTAASATLGPLDMSGSSREKVLPASIVAHRLAEPTGTHV